MLACELRLAAVNIAVDMVYGGLISREDALMRVAPNELQEKEEFLRLVESHRESRPMFGHQGCRLGLSYPAIYEMQVQAIITAGA